MGRLRPGDFDSDGGPVEAGGVADSNGVAHEVIGAEVAFRGEVADLHRFAHGGFSVGEAKPLHLRTRHWRYQIQEATPFPRPKDQLSTKFS